MIHGASSHLPPWYRSNGRLTFISIVNHRRAGAPFASRRVLPQRLRPEPVAMRIFGLAHETDIAGNGDFLFDPAQVGAQIDVGVEAQRAILEGGAQAES